MQVPIVTAATELHPRANYEVILLGTQSRDGP